MRERGERQSQTETETETERETEREPTLDIINDMLLYLQTVV